MFLTIRKQSTGIYRAKGSKFLAFAMPVNSVDECADYLNTIKKDHPKARHYCFAYRIGADGQLHRSSDDGEPSGTAGRPIAQQIDAHDVTNVIVVVVRYFGGKLLGTSGLIHAYKESAADALSKAIRVEKVIRISYRLKFKYAVMGQLMEAIKLRDDVIVLDKRLKENPSILISVPLDHHENILASIIEDTLGLYGALTQRPWRFPDLVVEIVD